MKKTILIAIAIMMIAASSIMAFDGKGFAKMLELEEAQTQKIQKIGNEAEKKMVDLEANMKKAALEFKDVLKDKNASNSEILDAYQDVAEAEAAINHARVQMMLDIREELNDNQKEKFAPHLYKGISHSCHGALSDKHDCGMHGKGDAKSAGHECEHHKDGKGMHSGEHDCKHHR
ncbi:MAG: Spy/CpxP family protein refolding chaperone [Candidatus Zixiibacteriota bacterium]